MRRREVILMLGATVASPFAAHAQQAPHIYRIRAPPYRGRPRRASSGRFDRDCSTSGMSRDATSLSNLDWRKARSSFRKLRHH